MISVTIGEALRTDVSAVPILSFPLCCANTIGPAIRVPIIGDVQRIKKSVKLLIGAANSPHFASRRGKSSVPHL